MKESLKWMIEKKELVDPLLEEIEELIREDKMLSLKREYTRLFISSFPTLPCPPYESIYVSPERIAMSDEVEEVLDIMKRWGLKLSDDFRDLPEHVAVELELASFLLRKIAESTDREVLEIARKDYAVLEEHLKRWIPKFRDCVVRESREEFYKRAADLLLEVITAEFT